LKIITCGSRTYKPNSPGWIANKKLLLNQSAWPVNDVSLVMSALSVLAGFTSHLRHNFLDQEVSLASTSTTI
jgi:hypothetical protein